MTINGKIKVIDKDISDFSVDRTKKEIGEIKIDWTMTNNLLIEETLDELIKGMEIDKSVLQILQSTLAIYIEIRGYQFQNQKFMCQSTYRCRKLS
jgi:hypothetical protein